MTWSAAASSVWTKTRPTRSRSRGTMARSWLNRSSEPGRVMSRLPRRLSLMRPTFAGHLTIRDKGSPDGWIKYTARDGFVLKNDRTGPLLELYKAKYVILEGLTLRGGLKEAVSITKCEHVRVVNCDIAGWGRIGTQRFDLDGKYYTEQGRAINWDSAILVRRSTGTVVERCYIHDPVTTANPWYYSHPAGPQAVGIDKPSSTVIRYNDFIGSDLHRWNDAIEGAGNYHVDGGFNRDADIYGNLMCFANDDAVEIDGGQTNVRVFLNKFEGCLCGVSIQGCMSSPSYVFRNLLVNMGDENGVGGQTIKTSSYANGKSAVSFIFNNTCYGDSSDLSLPHNLRIVAKNNIFAGRSAISGRTRSPQSECDYNLLPTGEEGDEEHGILGAPGFVDPEAGSVRAEQTRQPPSGVAWRSRTSRLRSRAGETWARSRSAPAWYCPCVRFPLFLDRYQLVFSTLRQRCGEFPYRYRHGRRRGVFERVPHRPKRCLRLVPRLAQQRNAAFRSESDIHRDARPRKDAEPIGLSRRFPDPAGQRLFSAGDGLRGKRRGAADQAVA